MASKGAGQPRQQGEMGMAYMLAPDAGLDTAPEEARVRAISRILAAQAAHDEPVRRFRADALGGEVLAPDQVEAWIQQQAERDGPASYWLSGVTIDPDDIRGQPDGYVSVGPLRVRPDWHAASLEEPSLVRHMLRYASPGNPHGSVAVRAGGVLDRLRRLAHEMTDPEQPQYLWEPVQAVTFILTGLAPLARRYYDEALPRKRGQRDMSRRHLELAVFTVEHEGATLAARMAVWNAEHPEWSYGRVTTFGWDSRQSVKRVLGILEPGGARVTDIERHVIKKADDRDRERGLAELDEALGLTEGEPKTQNRTA